MLNSNVPSPDPVKKHVMTYESKQNLKIIGLITVGVLALLLLFISTGCSCNEDVNNHPKVASTTPISNEKAVVLNRGITATFSKVMNASSINKNTFIVRRGVLPVNGAVTYAGVTATFTPSSTLLPNTTYTVILSTGMKSSQGFHLVAKYTWSFKTGVAMDVMPPAVVTHTPLAAATDVPLNAVIGITFNEPIKATTITSESIVVTDSDGKIVAGELISLDSQVTFMPTDNLVVNTTYTVVITPAVTDLAGNALAALFTWSFTTSTSPILDITPPTVVSNVPLDGAIDIALLSNITVVFSEWMNPLTITAANITLTKGTEVVACLVTYDGFTATLNPEEPLYPNATYVVTIAADVADLANNNLAATYVFSFITLPTPDTTPPTVLLTDPVDGGVGVALNRPITITFSEVMRAETLSLNHLTVTGPGSTIVDGVVTYTDTTMTFTPMNHFVSDTTFNVVLEGVTDVVGNVLVDPYLFSFTTSAALARGPAPVLLGLAGNFAILSKAGVSAIPTTSVTGDIGCSPIDSTALTGFSLSVDASNQFALSSQVVGKLYAADYSEPTPPYLTTAVSNMETAYTDAAGRPTPDYTELGAGEIGGLTLEPGLYKWGTGISIATDVTLNGGPNDVWIFQIGQGLTMAAGVRMTLTGGALPKNIFWQVAGECVVATTAHFEGIALCQTAIILRTGATANGRLLAQTAVTLDQSTIVQSN